MMTKAKRRCGFLLGTMAPFLALGLVLLIEPIPTYIFRFFLIFAGVTSFLLAVMFYFLEKVLQQQEEKTE